MVSELAQYAITLVKRLPGHYFRHELVRKVRGHAIDTTGQDPGILQSKAYVDEAFEDGKIEDARKGLSLT